MNKIKLQLRGRIVEKFLGLSYYIQYNLLQDSDKNYNQYIMLDITIFVSVQLKSTIPHLEREGPESQGRIDAESSLSPPGHLWRMSRIARLAHRAILQKIQLNIELYLCKIWFFKLRKTGIFHLIIILPLHHIRPKLLRPLDFPDKIETISSY